MPGAPTDLVMSADERFLYAPIPELGMVAEIPSGEKAVAPIATLRYEYTVAVSRDQVGRCTPTSSTILKVSGLPQGAATRPSDRRELEDTADVETPDTGITQGWLLFEDVFVPNERVFMCREAEYTAKFIQYFTANYRACIGACVCGQGDVMIGASVLP